MCTPFYITANYFYDSYSNYAASISILTTVDVVAEYFKSTSRSNKTAFVISFTEDLIKWLKAKELAISSYFTVQQQINTFSIPIFALGIATA